MSKFQALAARAALTLAPAGSAFAGEETANALQPDATAFVGSAAAGITGTLIVNTTSANLGQPGLAKGVGPAAYDKKYSVKKFNKSITLPAFTTMTISTGPALDEAVSKGQVGSTLITSASSTLTNPSATVTNAIAGNLVTLTATSIASTAQFSSTTGKTPSAIGTVDIQGMTLTLGSALGGQTLTYTGKPTANQVLYKKSDGSVIVYLNHRISDAATITARPDATTTTAIEVDAIDVHLTDVSLLGQTVSGDVRVAVSYAN